MNAGRCMIDGSAGNRSAIRQSPSIFNASDLYVGVARAGTRPQPPRLGLPALSETCISVSFFGVGGTPY